MTAICLDVSRLVSRIGKGRWTGIDRVEAAWLDRLCRRDLSAYGLVRLALGYALLDEIGLREIAARLHGRIPWGPADMASRLSPSLSQELRQAESDIRRVALATATRPGLSGLIKQLPRGTTYLNTGHSNLSDRVLQGFSRAHVPIAVLIHDMIPLTHPQFQRPGTPATFEGRMRRVSRHADLAIYNSRHTRARAEARFSAWGNRPEGLVAPLGLGPLPEITEAPKFDNDVPFFVTLGTIEPRKNHLLLLDLWRRLGPQAPHLLILGRRGWANEEVFEILDTDPMMGNTVHEYGNLNDATVTLLLENAKGLLFPSYAEGYGLPALEAARLGTPVVATPLPAFKEILKDYPIYADASDPYSWAKAIKELVGSDLSPEERTARALPAPEWETHFNLVLNHL